MESARAQGILNLDKSFHMQSKVSYQVHHIFPSVHCFVHKRIWRDFHSQHWANNGLWSSVPATFSTTPVDPKVFQTWIPTSNTTRGPVVFSTIQFSKSQRIQKSSLLMQNQNAKINTEQFATRTGQEHGTHSYKVPRESVKTSPLETRGYTYLKKVLSNPDELHPSTRLHDY